MGSIRFVGTIDVGDDLGWAKERGLWHGYAFDAVQFSKQDRRIAFEAPHIANQERKDVALWPYLFRYFPDWAHGLQPTGDCTSWMQRHLLDVLHSTLAAAGKIAPPKWQVFGPSIYGFAKCELENSYRYHGAGATGFAVAEACRKFGWLYAKNYESGGNKFTPDNGLSVQWGDRGGGVPNWLEPFAAEQKAPDRVSVETPEQAGELIQAGYPVQYCGYTYWGITRGDDGVATRVDSGWHAMTATGVRWNSDGDVEALWIANTGHGKHCAGPVGPLEMPAMYSQCGSWVPRKLLTKVFAAGDCYAHSFIEGWPILDLPDWGSAEWL